MPKSGKQKRGKRTTIKNVNPSAQMQIYRGPTRLRSASEQAHLVTVELIRVDAFTTSGAGVFAGVIQLTLNTFNEYSSFTTLYDENRLLSAVTTFIPFAEDAALINSTGAVAQSLFVACLDRDSNTALTTLSGGFQYESSKVSSITKRNVLVYKMTGSEDAGFASTSAVNFGNFKYYGANFSPNTTYGYLFTRALFQLRGRL